MSYLFDELYEGKEGAPAVEDKILLMGLQAAGKTAIKDVVFFDKVPDDMVDYMATVHYQRHFIDEEKKSLVIDSGGQESYWNEAVTHFRHLVFSNVKLLVWVVDVTKPELFEESERRFSFTIRQYKKENPDGFITVLCHKVDLVTPERMVVIHQHIRELFSDPRFVIEFENTSIYYPESLKDLVFTVMREAGIDTRRFELVSNLGEAVEKSDEFQSYVMEHQEDPRIQELREFLNPEPEAILPTYGKLDLQFDLTEYDIVEMVLIEKETYSPIVGASTQSDTIIEKSMDYLIGLHEIKSQIQDLGDNIDPTGSILSTNDNKVHGMIFNLATNFLLITSFSEITNEKKEVLYELIFKFAQSTADKAEEVMMEQPAAPAQVQVAPVVDTPQTTITQVQPIQAEEVPVEVAQIEETPVEVPVTEAPLEVAEEIPVEMAEPVEVVNETQAEEVPEIMPDIQLTAEPEAVPQPEQITEFEPVKLPEAVPEVEVKPELKAELETGLSEILEVPAEEPIVETPVEKTTTEITEVLMQETGTFVSGELEVPEQTEAAQEGEIPLPEPLKQEDMDRPETAVAGPTEDVQIDFTVNDVKGFASFLMETKDELPEGIFSKEAVKSMSDWLMKGLNSKKTEEEN